MAEPVVALTDQDLLAAVARRDEAALAALYHRHGAALFRYALTLGALPNLAEEALQETFWAAWRAAERFDGASSVKTWLFAICRRRTNDLLRREGRYALPLEHAEQRAQATAEDEVQLRRHVVLRAIAALPPPHREVLFLVYYLDLTLAEVAQLLELPMGTVKSRLHYARRLLRLELRGEEDA